LGKRRLADRFVSTIPFALIALLYVGWRLAVIGNVSAAYSDRDITNDDRMVELAGFAANLFYATPDFLPATIALLLVTFASVRVLLKGPRLRRSLLLASGLAMVALPLWVLTGHGLLAAPSRYLVVPWFGLSLVIGYAVGRLNDRYILGPFVAALAVGSTLAISIGHQGLSKEQDPRVLEAIYQGVAELNEGQFILLPARRDVIQISGLARKFCLAHARLTRKPCRNNQFIVSRGELERVLAVGGEVYLYSSGCACLIPGTLASLRMEADRLDLMRCDSMAGNVTRAKPLRIQVYLAKGQLHWRLGPYTEGRYYVYMDGLPIPHVLPARGSSAFAPRLATFRVVYLSPDGWQVVSPELTLNPESTTGVAWDGIGGDENPFCRDGSRHDR
jgi:hypothetical protein